MSPSPSRSSRQSAIAIVVGFALSCVGGASTAWAEAANRAIVVLGNGSRIEVKEAWREGASYHLQLANGGVVVLPAANVKRVSHDAADLPGRGGTTVKRASGGGAPSDATAPSTEEGGPARPSHHRDLVAAVVAGGTLEGPGRTLVRGNATAPASMPQQGTPARGSLASVSGRLTRDSMASVLQRTLPGAHPESQASGVEVPTPGRAVRHGGSGAIPSVGARR